MSSPSITELPPDAEVPEGALERLGRNLLGPLKGAAFWTAVVLPFLHVPLLLATGLSDPTTAMAFVLLLGLNVLALLLGHGYRDGAE